MRGGSSSDRAAFATELGRILHHMEAGARRRLWDGWLRKYWEIRLDAIPLPLEDHEIIKMLGWTPHLDDIFPEAVSLAVQARRVVENHSSLLMKLRKSDLVERFPEATAQLLIYLGDCVRGHLVADLFKIASRIPPLPSVIDRELKEGLARAGAE